MAKDDSVKPDAVKVDPRQRIATLTELLAKLDEHAAQLATERARVSSELAKLLSKVNLHPIEPAAEPSRASAKTELARLKEARGKCAAMCIEDIDRVASLWSSSVSCVALGDACTFLVYDNAPPAYTIGLREQCPLLITQLEIRQVAMAPLMFAAIGSEDRFYLRYADGKQEWVASDECSADLKAKPVDKVSFGAGWADYCVLYADGSVSFRGLPPKLSGKLSSHSPKSPCITHVSLGPDGEWFVSFGDGTWEVGGCCDALGNKVSEVLKAGNAVKQILFGGHDAWIIRYNKPAQLAAKAAKVAAAV